MSDAVEMGVDSGTAFVVVITPKITPTHPFAINDKKKKFIQIHQDSTHALDTADVKN